MNSESWRHAFDHNTILYLQGEWSFRGGPGTPNSRPPKSLPEYLHLPLAQLTQPLTLFKFFFLKRAANTYQGNYYWEKEWRGERIDKKKKVFAAGKQEAEAQPIDGIRQEYDPSHCY